MARSRTLSIIAGAMLIAAALSTHATAGGTRCPDPEENCTNSNGISLQGTVTEINGVQIQGIALLNPQG